MTVLSTLKKLKTSTDFAAAIDPPETEHAAAKAEVATLEAKRENELFEGRNLDALEADISTAEDNARTLDIALTGARKRRTEAVEAERMAAIEKKGAAAPP